MTWWKASKALQRWATASESLDRQLGYGADKFMEQIGAKFYDRAAPLIHGAKERRYDVLKDKRDPGVKDMDMVDTAGGTERAESRDIPGFNIRATGQYLGSGGGYTSAKNDEGELYATPTEGKGLPGRDMFNTSDTLIISKQGQIYYREMNFETGELIPLLPNSAKPAIGSELALNWDAMGIPPAGGDQREIYNYFEVPTTPGIPNAVPDFFAGVEDEVVYQMIEPKPMFMFGVWGNIQPAFATVGHENSDLYQAGSRYKQWRCKSVFRVIDITDWHQSATGKNFVQARTLPQISLVEPQIEVMETIHKVYDSAVKDTRGGYPPTSMTTSALPVQRVQTIQPQCVVKVPNNKMILNWNKEKLPAWTGENYEKDLGWTEWMDTYRGYEQKESVAPYFAERQGAGNNMKATAPTKWKYFAKPCYMGAYNRGAGNADNWNVSNSRVTVPMYTPAIKPDIDAFSGTWDAPEYHLMPNYNCLANENKSKTIPYRGYVVKDQQDSNMKYMIWHGWPIGQPTKAFVKRPDLLKMPILYVRNTADTTSMNYTAKMVWCVDTIYEFKDPMFRPDDGLLGERGDWNTAGIQIGLWLSNPPSRTGIDVPAVRKSILKRAREAERAELEKVAEELEKEKEREEPVKEDPKKITMSNVWPGIKKSKKKVRVAE